MLCASNEDVETHLDGRAGQDDAPLAVDGRQRLERLRVCVFEAMALVGHEQADLASGELLLERPQRLVADDHD